VLPIDIRVAADTTVALPMLLDLARDRVARDSDARRDARAARRAALGEKHLATRAAWAADAGRMSAMRPIAPPWLAREVGEAIKEYDWVLTAGSVQDWALRLWDFDRPYRHAGRTLGTATQIGISLGVALAHRGSGKLVVDLQPDGDLLFDAAAPWIAAAHNIPMLVVMVNNRAYYNDWEHQIKLAEQRGSDMAKVPIGVEIDGPAPDFAMLAKAFGWYAEGPIEDPAAIRDAVKRAARVVMEQGRPALVDVVTAHR
jgi:benzoylformate decarboxylase/acetolactate synthase-1/2/3 large subunit